MSPAKHERNIIVGGAGTWGASLALTLARRGYTNVVALDAHDPPSQVSAGNDLNKILGSDVSSPLYLAMAKRLTQAWRTDTVYAPYWHETGRVKAVDGPNDPDAQDLRDSQQRMAQDPFYQGTAKILEDGNAIKAYVPQLQWLGSNIDEWYALYNGVEGWVHARGAILSVAKEAQRLGVRYVTGAAGKIVNVKPEVTSEGQHWVELTTADGQVWHEEHVVMCAGAWAPSLVDLQRQIVAKCWTVGHIQLTPEDAAQLKGLPVIHHPVKGFFFEPSEDGRIKICNEFPGYTHTPGKDSISVPSETKYAVPEVCYIEIRQMIQKLLPRFAHLPIIDTCICWCTDASDEEMLFDYHPAYGQSLLIASGDCGNGFHRMPVIGPLIADKLEGKMSENEQRRWRWRPEVVPSDPKKFAPWRPGHPREIDELPGWPMTKDPTLPSNSKV